MEYNLKKLVDSMWKHRKNKDFGRKELETSYRSLFVKASIGMTGNLAKIPWISYCAEGQETQKGIYPVLLFYGTPEFIRKNRNNTIVKKIVLAYGISANKRPDVLWGAQVDGKETIQEAFAKWKYKTSDIRINKYNSSYVYKTYDWTDDVNYDIIQKDVDSIIDIYMNIIENSDNKSTVLINQILKRESLIKITSSIIPYRTYITAIKSKPFLLLAGISGTGKSRIVRELARACWEEGSEEFEEPKPKNFKMIQVKPNWHDSSELIGYVSRVSGKAEFVAGDFLKFIAYAWENEDIPYFLCLDEMNLAPVEQYFAEYLSVIESRKNINGEIITDAIIEKNTEKWYLNLVSNLTENEKLREQFETDGITIPKNLIVVGTVNMDETTFSFSRKVLDRAMTIEMNEVDLEGGLDKKYESIGKLGAAELIGNAVEGVDVYADNKGVCDRVINYLKAINGELEGTPFKVAYRTRNEFLLYVVNNLPYNKDENGEDIAQEVVMARALDEITSMKILSRIEGDTEKIGDLLDRLKEVIKKQLNEISSGKEYSGTKDKEGTEYSVSLAKLKEMKLRLKSGYTCFWS